MGYFVNNAIPWKALLLMQYNQMLVLYKINSSDLHNKCLLILNAKSFSWQLSFECKKTIVSEQFPWRTAKMTQNFIFKSYPVSLFPKCPERLKDYFLKFFILYFIIVYFSLPLSHFLFPWLSFSVSLPFLPATFFKFQRQFLFQFSFSKISGWRFHAVNFGNSEIYFWIFINRPLFFFHRTNLSLF